MAINSTVHNQSKAHFLTFMTILVNNVLWPVRVQWPVWLFHCPLDHEMLHIFIIMVGYEKLSAKNVLILKTFFQMWNRFDKFNSVHKMYKYNLPESEILDLAEKICDSKTYDR